MASDAAARLQAMNLNAPPTLVPKKAPGTAGQQTVVGTNVWPLEVKSKTPVYKYDIRIYAEFAGNARNPETVLKEFTKQSREDYDEQHRKKVAVEVFLYLQQHNAIFREPGLIYDRAALLYSLRRLQGVGKSETVINLPTACQTLTTDATKIIVKIKECSDSFQVILDDLKSSVNADFKGTDKGVLEVLNVATSQRPFLDRNTFVTYGSSNVYLMDPARHNFQPTDAPPIGEDKYCGIGIDKSVKVFEGKDATKDKPNYEACLVADVKKTAFHVDGQLVSDKILSLQRPQGRNAKPLEMHQISELLKGLTALTTHTRTPKQVVIKGLTAFAVSQTTFDRNNSKVNVADYFRQKYQINLNKGFLPGVIDKYTKAIYPAEVLRIGSDQRARGDANNKQVAETMIRVSAIAPPDRQAQTRNIMQALDLRSEASQRTGVYIKPDTTPIEVIGRRLPEVKVEGGAQGPIKSSAGPSWNTLSKFVIGASFNQWAAIRNGSMGERECRELINMIVKQGKEKGMNIAEPLHTQVKDHSQLENCLTQLASKGCKFVMLFSSAKVKDHDLLKQLERKTGIITQQVTIENAIKMSSNNQRDSVDNIIKKMNEKMGGKNHMVAVTPNSLWNASGTLVAAYVILQPESADGDEKNRAPQQPAFIGLGANCGALVKTQNAALRNNAAQQYFAGAYAFANPKGYKEGETQLQTLSKLLAATIKEYKENRGVVPTSVIIYRGGVSEGQLRYTAKEEKGAIIDAFHAVSIKYNPALTLIAASKDHGERLYPQKIPANARKNEMNLLPGVVVDKHIVNPEFNEFFLQSHKPLQGTAKATKYTLISEPSLKPVTMDQIEIMTNELCHLHSVCSSTTAIPVPLYVAEETAKRAKEQYNFEFGSHSGFDLDRTNEAMSLEKIKGVRFNA